MTPATSRACYALLAFLFSGFVVEGGGTRSGIAVPLLGVISFVLLLGLRSTLVRMRPPTHTMSTQRRAKLRAQAIESERKRLMLREQHRQWLHGEGSEEAAIASPSHLRDKLLAAGPHGAWFANGAEAVRFATYLMVLPVGYYLYVLVSQGIGFDGPGDATPLTLLLGVAHEVTFWLGAAFTLGATLALLPTVAGVTKGMMLAVSASLAIGLGSLVLPSESRVGLGFRALELFLFLMVIGVVLDVRAVKPGGWQDLRLLYRLREVGPTVGYLAPVVLSVVAIAQQVLSGDASEAIQEAIRSSPNLVPGAPR